REERVEYKAELEEDNYYLRDALQTERSDNALEEEIAELRSEISSLKSQLYQAKKDV
ncbi:3100_t:CDS:2, partial [Funneliformis geosporum]